MLAVRPDWQLGSLLVFLAHLVLITSDVMSKQKPKLSQRPRLPGFTFLFFARVRSNHDGTNACYFVCSIYANMMTTWHEHLFALRTTIVCKPTVAHGLPSNAQ